MPSTTEHGTIQPYSTGTNLDDIKEFCSSVTAIIPPLSSYCPSHSTLLFIVLQHSRSPLITNLSPNPAMVDTRRKNRLAHPAAPVMTEAAKQKAGIKTKRRAKKGTKDADTIRELQARIAALENADEETFSKEPLVRVWT